MSLDLCGDVIEHFSHLFAGGDRLELAVGQNGRQIKRPAMTLIDDPTPRTPLGIKAIRTDAHQQPGHRFDRLLRRREPDPRRRLITQRLESFEADGEMAASLVARHGVNLVHLRQKLKQALVLSVRVGTMDERFHIVGNVLHVTVTKNGEKARLMRGTVILRPWETWTVTQRLKDICPLT